MPQLEKALTQKRRPNTAKNKINKLKKKKKSCVFKDYLMIWENVHKIFPNGDFPGGAVVKNPPANAGDTGSSSGPGRFHMPRSN